MRQPSRTDLRKPPSLRSLHDDRVVQAHTDQSARLDPAILDPQIGVFAGPGRPTLNLAAGTRSACGAFRASGTLAGGDVVKD